MTGMVEWKEYSFFRKHSEDRWGEGVAVCVNDQLECIELHLEMDEELTENFWISINGRARIADIMVEVCHSSPDQED